MARRPAPAAPADGALRRPVPGARFPVRWRRCGLDTVAGPQLRFECSLELQRPRVSPRRTGPHHVRSRARPPGSSVAGVQVAEDTHRLEVPVRPDRRESVAAALWALGATGVWERPDRTVGWFPRPPEVAVFGEQVPELTGSEVTLALEPDHDWQAAWKATIAPIHAGRTTIVPTWLAAGHRADDDELTLVLDPGRAFGTGHHATTALCLELLDGLDLLDRVQGHTLADVGCGSGILAIAAAARGAEVQAVDIDPEAVAVTRENAAANGLQLDARVGSIGAVDGPVDIVVANLISDVVRDLAAALAGCARRELVVSGITVERRDDVLAALTAAGAEVLEVRERDGWIAARLRPAAGPGADGTRRRTGGRLAGGSASLLTVLALAGATVVGCTTPEVGQPVDEAAEQPEAEAELGPQTQALADEVDGTVELVEEIRSELAEAADADTVEDARAALERADALLVTGADGGEPALLPIEPAERTESRAARDALTELLTQARETGGELGRSVVEVLRDPVAGDLGAWELDAPGVVATARGTGTDAGSIDAAAEQILALDGEATKAIAWIALGLDSRELEQAREAAQLADGHLEVVTLVLRDVVAAGELREDGDPDELGPVLEDPEELG